MINISTVENQHFFFQSLKGGSVLLKFSNLNYRLGAIAKDMRNIKYKPQNWKKAKIKIRKWKNTSKTLHRNQMFHRIQSASLKALKNVKISI